MDRLSAEDRDLIMDAVRETIKFDRELMAKTETEVLAKLKDLGIEINEMSLEERNVLSERMNGAINNMVVEKCGKEIYDMVHAEIKAERK